MPEPPGQPAGKGDPFVPGEVDLPHPCSPSRAAIAAGAVRAGHGRRKEGEGIRRLFCRGEEEVRTQLSFRKVPGPGGRDSGMMVPGLDVTEMVRREEEREALIDKLGQALVHLRVLVGDVPHLRFLKRVRDDQGYWNRIEECLDRHSDAQFRHGICPGWAAKMAGMISRLGETE